THFYQTADYFLPVLGFSSKEYQGDLEPPSFQPKKETVRTEDEKNYLIKVVVPTEETAFTYAGQGELYYKGNLVKDNQRIQISDSVDWLDLTYIGNHLTKDLETFRWEHQSK